ncbi:lipopolysaccharide assembly protein LapA domain-containing protein [Pseudomonas sp. GD03860]|uniref:lipopolysaccharide assembly protein LapA domain-containing protein n=1 Tax=Pseudomonas TaxID=286 RepID=UPI00236488ED|nr:MULTISPECIES: lipopolysaccharide assembly protein LapA domain-containing protein [Pseudomonas]MDD2055950.1 lipopolysaccharide assembly protein LapA domain-containing protein [Pseudomonas putida]MDH0638554.1 lipopolysaccharide assembly protein LapA domain-containing protein [Pseudomonas sp. GD03860]
MKSFKRFLLALFLIVIVVGGLVFVLENQQLVTLVFLGWSLPQLPVSVFVLLALLVGLAIGPILGLIASKRRLI